MFSFYFSTMNLSHNVIANIDMSAFKGRSKRITGDIIHCCNHEFILIFKVYPSFSDWIWVTTKYLVFQNDYFKVCKSYNYIQWRQSIWQLQWFITFYSLIFQTFRHCKILTWVTISYLPCQHRSLVCHLWSDFLFLLIWSRYD